jgi:hypothetical protein
VRGDRPHPGDLFHQTFLYHMALNGIQVVRARVRVMSASPALPTTM